MFRIKKIKELSVLDTLKEEYFSVASSPLDGMWHFGFVPLAEHFGFYHEENLVGFFCVDKPVLCVVDDSTILKDSHQFFHGCPTHR